MNPSTRRAFVVLLVLLAALTLGPAIVPSTQAAAPCHVPSSTYPTIQAAVNDPTCATILVAAGTYTEHVTIDRDVTIRGEGEESTIVDGVGSFGSLFTISSGTVTIQGVTIQHGINGIVNEAPGTLTLLNSTLSDNSRAEGGGIDNQGTLTIENSTLSGNGAHDGGGIFNEASGTLIIKNSTLSGNGAPPGGGGGGILNEGTLTIKNSTLADNHAEVGGGIANGGTLTIKNSTLSGNQAFPSFFSDGGGISNGGTLTIKNSTIDGNSAVNGGGIGNGGTLTIENSTLSGNSAVFDGGGIVNSGPLTIENSTFSDNHAGTDGGGIFNVAPGTVTLTHVTFQNNTPNECTGCP